MTRDEAIAAWQQAATLRKQWEAREHELRLFIASTAFGYNHAVEASLKTGNHDIELDNSRKLRLVTAIDTKIKDGERLRYTMQWLRDNTAVVYPKPLVSFKPTLSMATYNAVPQNMRDYLSPDIIVTNKLPTLEIIEPKK